MIEARVKANLELETTKAEKGLNDFIDKVENAKDFVNQNNYTQNDFVNEVTQKDEQNLIEPAQNTNIIQNNKSPLVEPAQNKNLVNQKSGTEKNIDQTLLQADQQKIEKNNELIEQTDSLAEVFSELNQITQLLTNQLKKNPNNEIIDNSNTHTKELVEKSDWFKSFEKKLANFTAASGIVASGIEWETGGIRKRTRLLNADVFGAEQEEINRTQRAVHAGTSILGLLGAVAGNLIMPGVGGLVGGAIGGGLGQVANTITDSAANNKSAQIEEWQVQSQLYQSRMPGLERSLVYFNKNNISNDKDKNADLMSSLNKLWTQYAENTGLDIEQFTSFVNNIASYGVNNKNKAGEIIKNAGLVSRYTGIDTDLAVDFLGQRERFGSKNSERDLNRVYSAAMNSGLGNGQFSEFLNGLENVIEQGISKGYVASTDEVAQQMIMFSKLSGGNDTWEGKYGFQRLSTINNGLASATSLSSSGQIAAYQALRGIVGKEDSFNKGQKIKGGAFIEGQDALNTLSLMEAGLKPESFKAIQQTLDNIYSGDIMGKVAAWKEISGLNWTGAMELAQMDISEMSTKEITDKLDELKADKELASDTTQIKNDVNKIKSVSLDISRNGLKVYMDKLKEEAGKTSIPVDWEELSKNIAEKEIEERPKNKRLQEVNKIDELFDISTENTDEKSQNRANRFAKNMEKILFTNEDVNKIHGIDDKIGAKNLREEYRAYEADGVLSKDEIEKLIVAMNNLNETTKKAAKVDNLKIVTVKQN